MHNGATLQLATRQERPVISVAVTSGHLRADLANGLANSRSERHGCSGTRPPSVIHASRLCRRGRRGCATGSPRPARGLRKHVNHPTAPTEVPGPDPAKAREISRRCARARARFRGRMAREDREAPPVVSQTWRANLPRMTSLYAACASGNGSSALAAAFSPAFWTE
jgi:hypothetical protein